MHALIHEIDLHDYSYILAGEEKPLSLSDNIENSLESMSIKFVIVHTSIIMSCIQDAKYN